MTAQTTAVAVAEAPRRSLLVEMAGRYGMEPKAFADTLRATVVPKDTSNEEFAAFLVVAREYDLNPLTKEIYAFPKRGGGIQPIVSVDGWCNLINSHPKLNGIEFDDHLDKEGKLTAITARLWRKDREKPILVTEYMAECVRSTDTWRQYPRRMLRHKALIQCARYAFGFAGIVDPDEAERMGVDANKIRAVNDDGPPPPPPQITHQAPLAPSDDAGAANISQADDGPPDPSSSAAAGASIDASPAADTAAPATSHGPHTQAGAAPLSKQELIASINKIASLADCDPWAEQHGADMEALSDADRREVERMFNNKSGALSRASKKD